MSAPNGDVRARPPSAPVRRDASVRKEASVDKPSSGVVTGLTGMYLLVAGAVACSWLIGFWELSFVYAFLLIASLFLVWKTKISKIVKQHLDFEETALYRRRAFRQNESVEWLNFLLNRWWVFSSYTIEQLVKKRLDERLWDIKPPFIDHLELITFTTGEQTPHLRNVQVFECSEGAQSHKPATWISVNKPPAGLDKMATYQLVIQSDVNMMSEDFRMIFRARVGSKKVNVGFDMAVEELQVSGTLQAILHLSMDVPFPHVTKATISFCEKPDVTFNLRMMKALQMMEVPLLKTWIHTNVMEGLTKALVDPSNVDLTLSKAGPVDFTHKPKKQRPAQGVLTVKVKGTPPKDAAATDVRYTVMKIGDRKRQTHDSPATDEWTDICTFFIYSLGKEELLIKSKCKRLLTSTTLEQKSINLSKFPFQVKNTVETTVDYKDGSRLELKLKYTALTPVNLETAEDGPKNTVTEVAGVMYVCIHGASNVRQADKTGASDPYCVLFSNRRRLLTTPYVMTTRNPRWESWVEFFVGDYSQSTFSFFVFDWDGSNTIDDDFLGVAHLSLRKEETCVVKRTLTLGYNRPDEGFTPDKTCGQLTVSLVFRPVASVAKSERFRDVMDSFKGDEYLYREDLMSPASTGSTRRSTSAAAYVDEYLEDKLIAELIILQGKDLAAMDRNGFSDPFCIVSMNGKKVFTTSVKKKTLFPKWNEMVTLEMKQDDTTLTIDVFDKDMISKDFLGKVTLTGEKLKELSVKGTADWFQLERTKTGKIQLKCQVISKDTLKATPESPEPQEMSDPFDSSRKMSPPTMIVDSSYLSSPETSLTAPPTGLSPGNASVRRSISDLQIDKAGSGMDDVQLRNYNSLPRQSSPNRRRSAPSGPHVRLAPSVNSVNAVQNDRGDTISIDSQFSVSNKLFSVSGTVHRARGMEYRDDGVYVKVRLEQPSSRHSLFSGTRILGKSSVVPASEPTFDTRFEVDRGHGVSADATLVFDIKHSSKEHIATKGFTLREILNESEVVCKWLQLSDGVELELSLSTGQPTPRAHRRGILKSLSFRKEK